MKFMSDVLRKLVEESRQDPAPGESILEQKCSGAHPNVLRISVMLQMSPRWSKKPTEVPAKACHTAYHMLVLMQ